MKELKERQNILNGITYLKKKFGDDKEFVRMLLHSSVRQEELKSKYQESDYSYKDLEKIHEWIDEAVEKEWDEKTKFYQGTLFK